MYKAAALAAIICGRKESLEDPAMMIPMRKDLDKEKKTITKQSAKRKTQIERVMEATVGMYGDLQGSAGKTFQEIEGLGFAATEDGTEK